MSKTIVIMGSSRPEGHSYAVCKMIIDTLGYKFQDLSELVILPYDYEHENEDDDYLEFMEYVTSTYDKIILVSPVYWYNVSGIMKNFIDRFTDLLTIASETGKKLKGKSMMMVSVSKNDDCPIGFGLPIEMTAQYLGMKYLGHYHFPTADKEVCQKRINEIKER